MQKIDINLAKTEREISIEPFYDWHIGSPKCDLTHIKERINRVLNIDNAYCILGGDLINNAIISSVSDSYAESLSPQEQINYVVNLLRPLAEKGKILAIVSGNHEQRTWKSCGIDITLQIAVRLGLTERYDPVSCLLFVTFGMKRQGVRHTSDGQTLTTIYCTHGSGGGSTVGGKANQLRKRGSVIDADIIITGHTHEPISFREARLTINRRAHTVSKVETLFVNASSDLGYENYVEKLGLPPSSNVSPVIVLNDHDEAKVIM